MGCSYKRVHVIAETEEEAKYYAATKYHYAKEHLVSGSLSIEGKMPIKRGECSDVCDEGLFVKPPPNPTVGTQPSQPSKEALEEFQELFKALKKRNKGETK